MFSEENAGIVHIFLLISRSQLLVFSFLEVLLSFFFCSYRSSTFLKHNLTPLRLQQNEAGGNEAPSLQS